MVILTAALLALVVLLGDALPTDQSLVYYNARMALREDRPREAVKLWLLRNAIESERRVVSHHDPDFHSVTWAALGILGLCQDGFPKDETGAGIWPLAAHNWVVKNMRRQAPGLGGSPFVAFQVGRQQRDISIRDVLDVPELETVRFRRTFCFGPRMLLPGFDFGFGAGINDRRVAARTMRKLLRQALDTIQPDKTIGRAAIEARIFDLNLRLAALSAKAARRAQRRASREARESGLSRTELAEGEQDAVQTAVPMDSEEGQILRQSLSWSAAEWMALDSQRRLFLFAYAARAEKDSSKLRPLQLAIIDQLLDRRMGKEVQSWIGHHAAGGDPATQRAIWEGERGRRLLSLDRETGFRERATISLHRGIDFLSSGRQADALRSLAHALRWAESSRKGDEIRSLSRRWLSFVSAQFRMTDELLAMLRNVVPRADFSVVLEDQLWHAALSADDVSFERCLRYRVGRGALGQRIELLRPLATGDAGEFLDLMDDTLAQSPYFALRFLKQFVQRIQSEDAEVRARHVPGLQQLKGVLETLVEAADTPKRRQRQARALIAEMRAVVEGLVGIYPNPNADDKASALSPESEVFVGSFRVAPSDPLPWPFKVAEIEAPSVFTPISLRPEEWRGPDQKLIYGWRIGD